MFDISETEIRDELRDHDIVGDSRVTMKKDGMVIPTNTLFQTLFKEKKYQNTFVNLKKRHYVSKQMIKLINAEDDEIKEPLDINKEVNFYSNMYKSQGPRWVWDWTIIGKKKKKIQSYLRKNQNHYKGNLQ